MIFFPFFLSNENLTGHCTFQFYNMLPKIKFHDILSTVKKIVQTVKSFFFIADKNRHVSLIVVFKKLFLISNR